MKIIMLIKIIIILIITIMILMIIISHSIYRMLYILSLASSCLVALRAAPPEAVRNPVAPTWRQIKADPSQTFAEETRQACCV